MKLLFAFFTLSLLLLLLFAGSIDGRKELGEYRKNAMTEQPMAEVIRDLVPANHQEDTNSNAKKFFVDDLSQPYGVFAWIKNKPKEGRKETGGYWKKMMKEEPMPEIFQELLANIHQKDANLNAENLFVDDLSQPYGVYAWIKKKPKEGRKEAGGYWKKVKKEEPMPAEDLVHNQAEAENNANAKEEKPGFNGESSPRHCDDEEIISI
ncbi:hypothetical protein Patl1_36371 [Pistacia atlantica]|nr:hypothetical protein Patl1_36371 [Pistacia atlantica]